MIQLNLVRSINTVADAILQELDDGSEIADSEEGEDGATVHSVAQEPTIPLTDAHRALVERLKPLRAVQTDLEQRLGSGAEEDFGVARFLSASGQPVEVGHQTTEAVQSGSTNGYGLPDGPLAIQKSQEFYVRSNGWKSAIARLRPRMSTSSRTGRPEGVDDPNALVISEAKNTIKALWTDSAIQEMIKRRKVRLQDCAELCVRIDLCNRLNSLNQCFSASWVKSTG